MDPLYNEALQKAVDEYNDWATRNGSGYSIVGAYNELRGIFYNKLTSLLSVYVGLRRGNRRFSYRQSNLLSILPTERIICRFVKGGYLEGLTINPFEGKIDEVVVNLIEASNQIIYDRDPHMRTIKEAYRRIANL